MKHRCQKRPAFQIASPWCENHGQGSESKKIGTVDRVAILEDAEENDKEKCKGVMTPENSSTEESRNGKETAERSSSEDRGIIIEIENERR